MSSVGVALLVLGLVGQELRLDIEEAQRIAREHSPAVRASRLTLEASRVGLQRARAERFFPQLDFSLSAPGVRQYTAQQVDPQTGELALYPRESTTLSGDLSLRVPLPTDGAVRVRLGGQRWEDAPRDGGTVRAPLFTSTLGLSLEQPILPRSGGARLALEQASFAYEIALANFHREELDLDYRVAQAFLAAVRAQEQARIDSVELDVAVEYAELARRKLASGLLSKGDALDLELREATTRAAYLSSLASRSQAREDLLLLLGLDVATPVELVPPEPRSVPPLSLEAALTKALERRREIRAQRLRRALAASRLAQTRYDQGPALTLSYGVDLVRRDSSFEPAWDGGQRDRSLTVALSIPLVTFGRRSTAIDQASLAVDQEDVALTRTEREIVAEVRSTFRSVESTRARVGLLEQALRVAEENYEVANARFEAGTINSRQLQDAQLALFKARTALLAARIDLDLALRRLEKVTLARLDELQD